MVKAILVVLAATISVGLGAPAFADYLPGEEPKAERRTELEMMLAFLSGEQFTPSRLEFRQLSSDPVRDLVNIAESKKYATVLRARAIQSLPLYLTDERALTAVDQMMTKTSVSHALFGPSLVAYAAMHGEAVTEAVAPYAEHPNAAVRLAAVVALGRFCGQVGYETLKGLVDREEDPAVKARIQQLIN